MNTVLAGIIPGKEVKVETISVSDFLTIFNEIHPNDTGREVLLKGGSYERHYENGDIYKHEEILKPNSVPSSYSGSYFSDDFEYFNYWNGKLIV
jgi:hypothetical protein